MEELIAVAELTSTDGRELNEVELNRSATKPPHLPGSAPVHTIHPCMCTCILQQALALPPGRKPTLSLLACHDFGCYSYLCDVALWFLPTQEHPSWCIFCGAPSSLYPTPFHLGIIVDPRLLPLGVPSWACSWPNMVVIL